MSYAAYIQNTNPGHHKHYWCAVCHEGGSWVVKTAWGRIGFAPQDEKTYTGGKGHGDFAGEHNAAAYANAIIRNKVREGYMLSFDGAVNAPSWWPDSGHAVIEPKMDSSPRRRIAVSDLAEMKSRFVEDEDDAEQEEKHAEPKRASKIKPRFLVRKV